jgi:hypothetical protein
VEEFAVERRKKSEFAPEKTGEKGEKKERRKKRMAARGNMYPAGTSYPIGRPRPGTSGCKRHHQPVTATTFSLLVNGGLQGCHGEDEKG